MFLNFCQRLVIMHQPGTYFCLRPIYLVFNLSARERGGFLQFDAFLQMVRNRIKFKKELG